MDRQFAEVNKKMEKQFAEVNKKLEIIDGRLNKFDRPLVVCQFSICG
ncbi:MAG: hypothetical protein HEP80_18230 [Dolichospermum sp. UKL201]|jgi:hypothetical protein|nr:MAG: hypothetical protein HEP80_18230 [Dolichospermum sp. UKL201]